MDRIITKADTQNISITKMQRESIIEKLKERGCRITKQRLMLLDIILEEECSCCKEIYYKACEYDPKIGAATVYRMVNTLEEIGVISRKNMYRIACEEKCGNTNCHNCAIELDDGRVLEISSAMLIQIIRKGLEISGITDGQNVKSIVSNPCDSNSCTIV